MISREDKHLSGGDMALSDSVFYPDAFRFKPSHVSIKHRGDLPRLDSVFDVRAHPIFYGLTKLRLAMNQCDSSATSIKLKSRLGSGILPPDHNDVLLPVLMRLGVIVRNVGEMLAGHIQ